MQIVQQATQGNLSREPSYDNLIKYFEIAESEKEHKVLAKDLKDRADDSLMLDIEAAYNDV